MRIPLPLNEALLDLRVAGNLVLHEAYKLPWSIEVPDKFGLGNMLALSRNKTVLAVHVVKRGEVLLTIDGHDPLMVGEREFVICANGAPHRLSLGKHGKSTPIADALDGRHPSRTSTSEEIASELVCGVFVLQGFKLNPMLAALPAILHGSSRGEGEHDSLSSVVDLLIQTVDNGAANQSFTINRLMELLFSEAIHDYLHRADKEPSGWFRGLADPMVSAAMTLVHEEPGYPWTVGDLANRIGMSASRFAARFKEATGQTVLSYVSQWRMHVATNMLQDHSYRLTDIAELVGYESFPAFSRSFKRIVGVSPSAWRKALLDPND